MSRSNILVNKLVHEKIDRWTLDGFKNIIRYLEKQRSDCSSFAADFLELIIIIVRELLFYRINNYVVLKFSCCIVERRSDQKISKNILNVLLPYDLRT